MYDGMEQRGGYYTLYSQSSQIIFRRNARTGLSIDALGCGGGGGGETLWISGG